MCCWIGIGEGGFELVYVLDASITKPTVVQLGQYYNESMAVYTSSNVYAERPLNGSQVFVYSRGSQYNGETVSVTIQQLQWRTNIAFSRIRNFHCIRFSQVGTIYYSIFCSMFIDTKFKLHSSISEIGTEELQQVLVQEMDERITKLESIELATVETDAWWVFFIISSFWFWVNGGLWGI